ncbi:DUF4861 family protein [uncultured Formosa sp.]|uniref:DUF4861 family protein n=1 Tax=uncultured Formosa sp. TaxID=255435 RepID=UPI002630207B|nr:DUF4861 family protein [uncultured Formosa sp.]
MKTRFLIFLLILGGLLSCKNTSKESESVTKESKPEPVAIHKPKTYAEISIAQGGEWTDGSRGHKEYSNGTTFKNVTKLTVPKAHTDHSWYLKYEGPGWESNKVGYRLYLDWRNAIDIFGKVTDSLELYHVGQDGFDSYHEMSDWGMDILKAGKSLGIGSIGRYVNDEVLHFNSVEQTTANVENNTESSSVLVNYKGWKTAGEIIDLKSILSIKSESRITKHTIQSSKAISGICTGIVNHNVGIVKMNDMSGPWAYIATYGEQTLVPDQLGMALFYMVDTVDNLKEGKDDHLVIFKPTTAPITFYFLAAWEKEKHGITNQDDFFTYLNEKLAELNTNNDL